jgi:hypothetical protein
MDKDRRETQILTKKPYYKELTEFNVISRHLPEIKEIKQR